MKVNNLTEICTQEVWLRLLMWDTQLVPRHNPKTNNLNLSIQLGLLIQKVKVSVRAEGRISHIQIPQLQEIAKEIPTSSKRKGLVLNTKLYLWCQTPTRISSILMRTLKLQKKLKMKSSHGYSRLNSSTFFQRNFNIKTYVMIQSEMEFSWLSCFVSLKE